MAQSGGADGLAELRALESSWARVRTGAALLTVAHVLTYPAGRRRLSAVAAALAAVNVAASRAQRSSDPVEVRRLGRVELAADAALATGAMWLSSDEDGSTWALLLLPVLEAALRDELRGARRTWAVLSAAFVARELVVRRRVPAAATAYRLALVLVVAQTLGERVRELGRTRTALSDLANTDSLTGLPNRRLLDDRLSHGLSRRRRPPDGLAVIVLDLDGLKLVNDTRGHAAGDAVLRSVADSVRASVRPEDTVARMGGDEFVVLLEHATAAEAVRVAERVRAAVADAGGPSSVGVAWCDGIDIAPADLLRSADRAMYAAKRAGGDRVSAP